MNFNPSYLLSIYNSRYMLLNAPVYTHGNQKRFPTFPTETTPQLMEWLGYWIGDGWTQAGYHVGLITFGGDKDLHEYLIDASTRLFCKPFTRNKWDREGGGNAQEIYLCSKILVNCLVNELKLNKHVLPDWIMNSTKIEKTAFLRGWFEADGCAWIKPGSGGILSISMKSDQFAYQCVKLLGELEIYAAHYQSTIKGVRYNNVYIPAKYRSLFRETIGFMSARKRQKLDELCGLTAIRERSKVTGRFVKDRVNE